MAKLDDLLADTSFTTARRDGTVTFLPEPERRTRKYTVISVDDHIVEPPDTFEGRVPAKFADRAPRVVEKDDGTQVWVYDGEEFPNVGFNAVVGRPVERVQLRARPVRRDAQGRLGHPRAHPRHGPQRHLRLAVLPVVPAGLRRPAHPGGHDDPELALATVRAWNDWHIEEWAGSYPGRIIPCQLPYLLDPEVAAEEIRRNAERGFKAVTFSEMPHELGLPSLHSGHWDPLMRACAETGTVVNLHIGSSSTSPSTSDDAPPDVIGVLFFGYAMFSAVDWLYSRIPVRFPDIRSASPRAASAGCRRSSTGSTTCSATTRCTARGAGSSSPRPR